jgi:hypothetical protein
VPCQRSQLTSRYAEKRANTDSTALHTLGAGAPISPIPATADDAVEIFRFLPALLPAAAAASPSAPLPAALPSISTAVSAMAGLPSMSAACSQGRVLVQSPAQPDCLLIACQCSY